MSVKAVYIIFFILILVSTILTIRLKLLTIKSVDVQTDKVACTNPGQIKDSSNLLGQNIILLNSSKVKDVIKNKFLCVKDVQISRRFPDRVGIYVLGREPKALLLVLKDTEASRSASIENIATPSAKGLEGIVGLEVDEEGVIFAKSTNEADIPKIYYFRQDLAVGQRVPIEISESLKILEKVKAYGLDVKVSEVLDRLFLIYPKEGGLKIIFKLGENLKAQLASLQLILNQAKIDENQLEFIDLRFDKPVIKLAPKKT